MALVHVAGLISPFTSGVGGGDPEAVLFRMDHQSTSGGGSTYPIVYGASLGNSVDADVDTDYMGAKNGTNTWNWSHETTGGYSSRNFMRFYRWVTVDGDPVTGFYWNPTTTLSPETFSGLGNGPNYLRFRMRTNAYLGAGGHDAGMKWFIWGGPGVSGERRMIFWVRAGSAGGGSDASNTTLEMRAGVSGNYCQTTIANSTWVHVQLAWYHESSGNGPYMRIYVDNNTVGSPTAEHTAFTADSMGGSWLKPESWGEGHWADIVTTGSTSTTDAELDFMDMEFGTTFDNTWYPG